MNVPNYLKFEENFEDIAVSSSIKVGLQAVKARYSEEITDQDIQIYFENDGNLEEIVDMVGDYRKYNAYQGTLGFVISTNRAKVKNHSDKLAKVRFIMMPENQYLENEYYQILEVKEESAVTDLDEENNNDVTFISFGIKYFLK